MKQVLLLTPGERHWWRNDGHQWLPQAMESDGPIWVITDLAEESLAESKIPRLFGKDRSAFVQRQLAGRYPDTLFRGAMPVQSDDPLGALVPTRFAMFGIDAADRINVELDGLRGDLAGVWPISMLVGSLAGNRLLPPDLFVVFPGAGTLRIVYLKKRTPILTRLTLTPDEPRAQIEEIVRTIRHLENAQAVPRDRKAHALLYLGGGETIEPLLAPARLVRVDFPRKARHQADDWRFLLFDLVIKSPIGQVAPLSRRVRFQSARVKKIARNLAILVTAVGLLAASNNLFGIYRMVEQRMVVAERIQDLDDQIQTLNAQIGRYGVSPELVRKAIALSEAELDSAPAIENHLRVIAQALARDPNVRARELQWRLIQGSVEPCVNSLAGTANAPDGKAPGADIRRTEMNFEIAIPESYGPRDRALVLRGISEALASTEGVTMLQDANKEQASGSLRGGSIVSGVTRLGWCLTFPGKLESTAIETAATKR